ncbi:MAG: leucine-rich repeat domain-containing protein [Bacteroidales bacterium]|nr:leucine-rich repeat domain-containing protein [Bacteroidales bacterium]
MKTRVLSLIMMLVALVAGTQAEAGQLQTNLQQPSAGGTLSFSADGKLETTIVATNTEEGKTSAIVYLTLDDGYVLGNFFRPKKGDGDVVAESKKIDEGVYQVTITGKDDDTDESIATIGVKLINTKEGVCKGNTLLSWKMSVNEDGETYTLKIEGSGVFSQDPEDGYVDRKDKITAVDLGGVTILGKKALEGFTALGSVTIPSSVSQLEDSVFHNCTSLTSVEFEGSSPVLTFGNGVFAGCTSMTSFTIPDRFSVYGNGEKVFRGSSIVALDVESPNGYCASPDGKCLIKKGDNSFRDILENLEGTYYVPNKYKNGDYDQGVTQIGKNAFKGSKLSKIVLSEEISYIYPNAFDECEKLEAIYLRSTSHVTLSATEFDADTKVKVYVAADQLDNYKADAKWKNHTLAAWYSVKATGGLKDAGLPEVLGEGEKVEVQNPYEGKARIVVSDSEGKQLAASDVLEKGGTWEYTMPAQDVTIKAEQIYSLQLNLVSPEGVSHNGEIVLNDKDGEAITQAREGDEVYIVFKSLDTDKYEVESETGIKVTANGKTVATTEVEGGNYKFDMPAGDVKVEMRIVRKKHQVSSSVNVDDSKYGWLRLEGSTSKFAEGEKVYYTIEAGNGYELSEAKAGDTDLQYDEAMGQYYFTMPNKDVMVAVKFSPIDIAIETSVNDSKLGAVKVRDAEETEVETSTIYSTLTLDVEPVTGCEVENISVLAQDKKDDVFGYDSEKGTITVGFSKVSVSVVFKKTDYKVGVGATENGIVEVSSTANYDSVVVVAVKPYEGYELDELTVDGSSVKETEEGSGVYTFKMPAKDVEIAATFKKSVYTITVVVSEGGELLNVPATGSMGDEIKFNTKAAKGYVYAGVYVSWETIGSTYYTDSVFTMPAEDVEILGSFERKVSDITLAEGVTGGKVVIPMSAAYGDTVSVAVEAEEGYEIAHIYADGEEITGVILSERQNVAGEFKMPDRGVEVSAQFKPIIKEAESKEDEETGAVTVTASSVAGLVEVFDVIKKDVTEYMDSVTVVLDQDIVGDEKIMEMNVEEQNHETMQEKSVEIPTIETLKGSIEGQGNVIRNIVAQMSGLVNTVEKKAEVNELVMDSTTIYIDPTDAIWTEKDDTIFVHILAKSNKGAINNFAFAGRVVVDKDKIPEGKEVVICIVGENEGSINGFYYDFDMMEESANKRCITIKQNIGCAKNGGRAKVATSKAANNKTLNTGAYDEAEVNKMERSFTAKEFASGEVAYWLNWSEQGYTGEYRPIWRQGKNYPELAMDIDGESNGLYKIEYEVNDAEKVISNPVFANNGDKITIAYSEKPESIKMGDEEVEIGDESATFVYHGNEVVSIKFKETTGVREVEAVGADVWHDLSGRKLAGKPGRKGVYVHNGKVEIVK